MSISSHSWYLPECLLVSDPLALSEKFFKPGMVSLHIFNRIVAQGYAPCVIRWTSTDVNKHCQTLHKGKYYMNYEPMQILTYNVRELTIVIFSLSTSYEGTKNEASGKRWKQTEEGAY